MIRRQCAIRAEDVNTEERRIRVSLSSEEPVNRYGAGEVLVHETKAVDLTQLRAVGGVLFNHDPDQIVGRPDAVELDTKDRVVRADVVFDDDPESERLWQKVQSGSLRGVSVGYVVGSYRYLREDEKWTSPEGRNFAGPLYVIEKWKPLEFSLTPVPADGSVGVGRTETPDDRSIIMPPEIRARLERLGLASDANDADAWAFMEANARQYAELITAERDTTPPAAPEETPAPAAPPAAPPAPAADTRTAGLETREQRDARHAEIRTLCELDPRTAGLFPELVLQDVSVADARARLLAHLRTASPPSAGGERPTRVDVGEEERTKWRAAATDRLLGRCSLLDDESPTRLQERRQAASQVRGRTLVDLLFESAHRMGWRDAHTMATDQLFQRVLAHSESDFPLILADVANKNLLAGFINAVVTWDLFCSAVDVPDFKSRKIYKLGDSGELELTDDNEPMPEGTVPEAKEEHAILSYAKRFGIGRKALINDDLGAFTRIPMQMGQAAARLPNRLFYTLLESASGVGPTMAEDSEALFSASHTSGSNYTSTGTALSVTSLGVARALFRNQLNFVAAGETASPINVTPRYLLVPPALETLADQLITSEVDPAKSNATRNPFNNRFQVVSDAYLTTTQAWYLASDPGALPGCEAAFLEGRREPIMFRQEHTNTLGLEWAVLHDVGIKFFEHRAWYRNAGA